MNPLDLKEREDQAAGNAETSNIGQADYDEKFNQIAKNSEDDDFDDIINNNYGDDKPSEKLDSHGDKVQSNYNAGDNIDDVKDQEESPDSMYKSGSGATRSRSGLLGRLTGRVKKYGATGGIIGVLGGGMAVISIMLSPAALFASIEKSVTNDGSDSARTNVVMRRAYMGGLIGGGECTGSKLKCKMVSATKEQIKSWTSSENKFKVKGTVVDSEGKPTGETKDIKADDLKDGERVKVASLEFPNGVVAESNKAFEAETNRSTESRRFSLRAFNNKASFFLNAKFNKVISKFGISKGSIAKEKSKPSEKEKAGAKVQAETDKASSKVNGKITTVAAGASGISTGIVLACTAYNITRIVIGAVKAKWIYDIVSFSLPFVQIASKIADGSATDADFTEIEGRANQLTWYPNAEYTKKQVAAVDTDDSVDSEDKDKTKKMITEKENLTATDSQGLRMAMYGDNTSLTDYTLAYTTGGIGSIATASKLISSVQESLGGKENVRQACIEGNRAGMAATIAQAAACFTAGAITFGIAELLCLGKQAASVAIYMGLAIGATYLATEGLKKALETADLPSDLRGVDAGNALAAGIGLMLSRTSRGNGLKPATSLSQVKNFIAATDGEYDKNVVEIAKDDARQNPLDLTNEYSFASTMATSLNPYISGQKSGFSFAANAFSVISNSLNPTANALHSEPSLMTSSDANLNHRLNVVNGQPECLDSDKKDLGILCDYSGRMVGVTSPRVIEWTNQMANGDITPLTDTIDYMQQQGSYTNIGNYGEADQDGGGTFDDTCNNLGNIIAAITSAACDDSRQASIKDDGTVVDKSQYSLYKKNCTEDRELDLGSSDDVVESGSDKDQDWMTGKQCAKDSMMMDRFAFYYNMCEVQYATANNATDCVNDAPFKSASNTTPETCASNGDTKAIYTCALKYDNYKYVMGGGHGNVPNATQWIADFKAGKVPEWTPILDCSGLVRMAFVEAMGIEDQAYVAPGGYDSSKYWDKIPLEQAQQGDIVTSSGHVAIVESNDTAGKKFKIFDAETEGGAKEDNIRHSSESYGNVISAYRAKKGVSV